MYSIQDTGRDTMRCEVIGPRALGIGTERNGTERNTQTAGECSAARRGAERSGRWSGQMAVPCRAVQVQLTHKQTSSAEERREERRGAD